jgi:hypothetical protein
VVWRSQVSLRDHDIVGIAIDADGKQIPLSIATSPVDERDPSILSLGGGTFLVAYEKGSSAGVAIERRIAGRFVTFGRRRSVR